MNNFVLLSEADLRRILREEIAGISKPVTEKKSRFNIDDALEYLNKNGFSISKNTLYIHTSKGTIDFDRFGKRKIVFSQEQLDDFLEKMLSK